MLALVAVSVWLALAVMLVWSAVATVAYFLARRQGMPDIMASTECRGRAMQTGALLGRIWVVGVNAIVFARVVRPVLTDPAPSLPVRALRPAALGVGLVLFGVTMAHYMLRSTGLQGTKLLAGSMVGVMLNVPYRVLSGALTLQLLLHAVSLPVAPPYI
jgi:hypothetical protein